MPDVTPIRNPLSVEALSQFMANVPPSAHRGEPLPSVELPLSVSQFRFGQLNPTYHVVDARGQQYVLRRKPEANARLVSKLAHAIEREFFILHGVLKTARPGREVPVPKVYVLCEDESVLGQVFYLMEYVEGRLIKNPDLHEVPEAERPAYWKAIMFTVSAIHSVDCEALVQYLPKRHFPQFQPEVLAKSKALYFERQMKTLTAVEARQAETVDPIPHFDQLKAWMLAKAPKDPAKLTLIHGDCKIDNVLFHPTEPRIIAVLDWELCTFGHPLFDLANLLQPFVLPQALNKRLFHPDETDMGREKEGTQQEVERLLYLYQKCLGHPWSDNPRNNPVDLWGVGVVFGLLRLCVISQGVAMRVAKGVASSGKAAGYASLYKFLAELAMETVDPLAKL